MRMEILTVGEDVDGLVVEVEEGMHAAPHALHGPVAGEDVGVELQVPGHVVPLEQASLLLLVGVHGVVAFGGYLVMPLTAATQPNRDTHTHASAAAAAAAGQAAKPDSAAATAVLGSLAAPAARPSSGWLAGDARNDGEWRGSVRTGGVRARRLRNAARPHLLQPPLAPPPPRPAFRRCTVSSASRPPQLSLCGFNVRLLRADIGKTPTPRSEIFIRCIFDPLEV